MTNPEQDYYAWTQETVEKLRQGRLAEVDLDLIAEEIEEMGRSERHELRNRLAVLLAHLLKWQYQPERRSRSWQLTIEEQRAMVDEVLEDNPSLKPQLPELGGKGYQRAITRAARETYLEKRVFPPTFADTGWSWEQVLDMDYLPE